MGKCLSKYLRYPQEDLKEELTSNKKEAKSYYTKAFWKPNLFRGMNNFAEPDIGSIEVDQI